MDWYEALLSNVTIDFVLLTAALTILAVCYKMIWTRLHRAAVKSQSLTFDTFLGAIRLPFYALLAFTWLHSFIRVMPASFNDFLAKNSINLDSAMSIAIMVFILVVFNGFLTRVQDKIVRIEKNQAVPNSAAWVSACKLGRVISAVVFILVILSHFSIPMGQILAPTALAGIALSFGAKDVLSNVFGGIVVLCDRPFAVGDYVTIGNSPEGTVRYIGWRMTEVQLRNGRILHVPNGLVTTSMVTNFTEKTHWFVQKEIGLRYQDLSIIKEIAMEIEEWVANHELANRRRVSFARLHSFDDSQVSIRVRAYLKSSINVKEWYMFGESLLLFANEVVKKHGADFAFPTRTVVVDSGSEPAGFIEKE